MKFPRMPWLALAAFAAAAFCPATAQAYSVEATIVGAYVERPNLFFSHSATHVDTVTSTALSDGRLFDGAYNAASASADLATGEIRITLDTVGGTQAALTSRAQASASFRDEILFDWADANPTKQIPWSVRLTGESSGADGINLGTLSAGLGNLSAIFEFVTGAPTYDKQFSGLATVWKNQSVNVTMDLSLVIASPDGHAISADFGNTAAFTWELPDGVSATPASGVFLSAVPLPASAWLLMSGLSGLALLGRRRMCGRQARPARVR